jgi:hypothetical protein
MSRASQRPSLRLRMVPSLGPRRAMYGSPLLLLVLYHQ